MANNPFTIDIMSGQRGINQGFQNLGNALGNLRLEQRQDAFLNEQQRIEKQKEEQLKQRQSDFSNKLQEALKSGSGRAVALVATEYPEFQKQAREIFNFANEDTERLSQNGYLRAYMDPRNASKILETTAEAVIASGGQPIMTLEDARSLQGKTDDEIREAIGIGISMINPSLGQQLGNFNQQNRKLKNDFEIKKGQNKIKALQYAASKEIDELKKIKYQNEIKIQEEKLKELRLKNEAAQGSAEASKELATEAVKVVDDLLGAKELDDIIGSFEGSFTSPFISGGEQDLINKANRLQSLLTVDNLKLMSGVLTDRDIAFLTNVASGLNISDNGILGSEEGVRERLREIKQTITSKLNQRAEEATQTSQQQTQQSTQSQPQPTQEALDFLRNNPATVEKFVEMYGYRPEGF